MKLCETVQQTLLGSSSHANQGPVISAHHNDHPPTVQTKTMQQLSEQPLEDIFEEFV